MKYNFRNVDCKVCGEKQRKVLGKRIQQNASRRRYTTIVQCRRCTLIYPSPFPYPSKLHLQKSYSKPEQYFYANDETRAVQFWEKYAGRLERITGGKGKILDIGCGRGEFVYAMQQQGWNAFGIDVSSAFVQYAKKRYGIQVKNRDLLHCNFRKNTFEVVRIFALLEHIFEPREMMREIHRILKPGGIVLIEIPNEGGLFFRIANWYFWNKGEVINLSPTFPPYHVLGFTDKSIRYLLADTGFQITQMHTYKGEVPMRAHAPWIRAIAASVLSLGKLVNQGFGFFIIAKKLERN